MSVSQLLVVIAFVFLTATHAFSDRAADESNAIAKLELLGGKIELRIDQVGGSRLAVSFAGNSRFSDKHLRLLKPLKNLRSLDIGNVRITDASVINLRVDVPRT